MKTDIKESLLQAVGSMRNARNRSLENHEELRSLESRLRAVGLDKIAGEVNSILQRNRTPCTILDYAIEIISEHLNERGSENGDKII